MKISLHYLFIASFIFVCACKDKNQAPIVITPEVNVVQVGQMNIPVYSEFVGQTFGEADVEIQSRVDGWITSIHFKEGDVVKKGQLLYTVDDLPIRTKIDAAAAQVAQANTQMVKAKADLDRVRPLTEMNALSKRELDAAVANYNAARAQVDIASASLANTRIELSYTKIIAPISGIIGISKVQVGDYVGKGMGISTSALNTISSTTAIRVRFNVSEQQYLLYLKNKQQNTGVQSLSKSFPVSLILSDGSAYPEEGKIDLTNRAVDPQTGSITVQALFNNKLGLFRPGQYAKVRILTNTFENALLVPQQAINQLQNIYQVFVLNDSNKITPRVIKAGIRTGSNWIVKEGLKAGEKVAVIGNAVVKPGVVVKPIAMNWNYDSTSVK